MTSTTLTWRVLPVGEVGLLVEASPAVPLANQYALSLADALAERALPGVESLVPTVASLLVVFDPLQLAWEALHAEVHLLLRTITPAPEIPERIVTIPVRYGGDDGPDLPDVAATLGLSQQEVVALHCSQVHRVMMVGFAPGFPYLGPLPSALAIPRRTTPRTAVPAGSVAIAAGLTGIYPTRLPGGWHLIGRTTRSLFNPQDAPPALLAAGDGVRFVPLPGGMLP